MSDLINQLEYKGGVLYWREWKLGRRRNLIAGTKNNGGYIIINCGKTFEYAHRIVWKMHLGHIPEGMDIDHVNHDRSDNRIENLRVVTRQDNLRNKGVVTSNTGVMGVYWNSKSLRFTANITINKKSIHLGTFFDLESATQARLKAESDYGFHVNHGKA